MADQKNPFDIGTGGLVNSSMTSTPAAASSTSPVTPAASSQTAPTISTPAAPASAGYDPAMAKGAGWNVGEDQTVAGQLAKVTAEDSPVLQQARTQGLQTAASRGLVNSSLAVGAAEGAVLDRALAIASPDAATKASAGKYNADVANNMSLANAGAQNQSSQFNASAANAASLAGFDAAVKTTMQNADNATKVQLQNIDATTRTGLANIEANYKTLMQANASASDLYNTTIQQITAIMGNANLDAPAKQKMIEQQTSYLQSGLTMIGKMNNLGLDQLLTFAPGVGVPGASPPVSAGEGTKTTQPVAEDPATRWQPYMDNWRPDTQGTVDRARANIIPG